jgi:hypothetical protein
MSPAVRAAIPQLLAELHRLLQRTHQLFPSLGTVWCKSGCVSRKLSVGMPP